MEGRNKVVDIAKGIGILLIVFGHCFLLFIMNGKIYNVIFSVNVPIFFFLSGTFFNPSESFKKVALERFDALLKPYFITLMTVGIMYAILNHDDLFLYTLKMFYGNQSNIRLGWGPLWFLPHLFAVALFSWVLVNTLNRFTKYSLSKALLLISLLLIGVYSINLFWKVKLPLFNHIYTLSGLPFSIDIIFSTTFYYLLGHYLSEYIMKFKPSISLLLFTILIFTSCHYFFNMTIDFNLRRYDGFFISTTEALCGIYIIMAVSYYVQFSNLAAKALSTLGASSLFILIFHMFFQGKLFPLAGFLIGYINIIPVLLLCFAGASIIPALIWFLVKQSDYLSLLFMPLKHRRIREGSSILSIDGFKHD